MKTTEAIPHEQEWPEPLPGLLQSVLPPAPDLPLDDVVSPGVAAWVKGAAESKGAPADYVFVAILSVCASVIGNSRSVNIWQGWSEPPIIWSMCIGLPSSGKSPAIDAALDPLRALEHSVREETRKDHAEWQDRSELAKLKEQAWKHGAKLALEANDSPPPRPSDCDPGPPPHIPRLVVNDGTIERLGDILAKQPRGTLQMRDELAGWLQGMERYSGSSDRPFWLEAYGGRSFTVERMGRPPLTIDRLSICVLGGIQPDRLRSLLLKSDDDGLLARFLPIWPDRAPIAMPGAFANADLFEAILKKLSALQMVETGDGCARPQTVYFSESAKAGMLAFRHEVRAWEEQNEGLLRSFVGKLPGLAARLGLVLAYLDWAGAGDIEPCEMSAAQFSRAVDLIRSYFLPMARRAYAEAALPKAERTARRLVSIIRERKRTSFSSREALRWPGMGSIQKADLDPALIVLEEGDCIRKINVAAGPNGGRPPRTYEVNPALHQMAR